MSTETCYRLNCDLYPIEAVQRAVEAFTGLCDVRWTVEEDMVSVECEPRADAPPGVVDEFLNFALEAALDLHLSKG